MVITKVATPAADAGADKIVSGISGELTGSTTLDGAGLDDPPGTITAYQWTVISGTGVFSSPTTATTNVTVPVGTHIFRLTVTDDDDNTSTDDVTVIGRLCPGDSVHVMTSDFDGVYWGKYIDAPGYELRAHKYPTYDYASPVIQAGDTIKLAAASTWEYFTAFGYGEPSDSLCPIVLTYEVFPVNVARAISLKDCNAWKIDGRRRDPYDTDNEIDSVGNKAYGIRIGGSAFKTYALEVNGFSSHIEGDKIRIENVYYFGGFKTDPPQNAEYDTAYVYNRTNPELSWIMRKIYFHHIYATRAMGDGWYVGNTDPYGDRDYMDQFGVLHKLIPMRGGDNRFEYIFSSVTGRTIFQIGGAETGTQYVRHNMFRDGGDELNQQQGTGIAIGGMTRNAYIDSNDIRNTFQYGIMNLAADSNFIRGNTLHNIGVIRNVDSSGAFALMGGGRDRDSLIAAQANIFVVDGPWLKNVYDGSPDGNEEVDPDIPGDVSDGVITPIVTTTQRTLPTAYDKTDFIMNNRIGYYTGAVSNGQIGFRDWYIASHWSENSIVCGNTLTDGVTPAVVTRYTYLGNPWPVYSTDCPVIELPFQFRIRKRYRWRAAF